MAMGTLGWSSLEMSEEHVEGGWDLSHQIMGSWGLLSIYCCSLLKVCPRDINLVVLCITEPFLRVSENILLQKLKEDQEIFEVGCMVAGKDIVHQSSAKVWGGWRLVMWGSQRVCCSGERASAFLFDRSSRGSFTVPILAWKCSLENEKYKSLSRVWFFVTPWTIQSMEFSRPEYWSG